MKVEVVILHHEYPSRLRDYAEEKIQQLERFFERTISIRAMLERQHDEHRAELVANVGRGVVLVVDAREAGIKAALDEAMDRMARVLKRHKAKRTSERRRVRAG